MGVRSVWIIRTASRDGGKIIAVYDGDELPAAKDRIVLEEGREGHWIFDRDSGDWIFKASSDYDADPLYVLSRWEVD